MFYEIAECIAVDGFEIMDKFNPKNLEENADVFDQEIIRAQIIRLNKQTISPLVHNMEYSFLLLLVTMETITPIKESIGPTHIMSIYE